MESADNSSKNLTLQDVRQALGETDPHQTNSAKLRAILGRGSNATIQRHLDVIRAEWVKAAQPTEAPVLPPMPDEFKALWAPVYTAAVATVRARLESLSAERDALVLSVATGRQDLAALEEIIEQDERAAAEQAVAWQAERAELTAALQAEREGNQKFINEYTAKVDELTAKHDQISAAHEQLLATTKLMMDLEKRDHALTKATLQSTINYLTDQVGELKAMRYGPAVPALAAPDQPGPATK